MTSHEIVASYLANNYRVVFWPPVGDVKGPTETGWPLKNYSLEDYKDGYRVGLMTGSEISTGRFLIDVDIDWAPGSLIAQSLIPLTGFVFGRPSKKISHCFYTVPEAIPSMRFEDIDKTCLIELRGTARDGSVAMQTMTPPSIWSKGSQREALAFVKAEAPSHVEVEKIKRRVLLAAVGMIVAKHLGHNGFGHEPRLCLDGFLLRLNVTIDELEEVGKAISVFCNNREVIDVRRAAESTSAALIAGKKVKGGPALAKLIGPNGRKVIARVSEWFGGSADFVRDSEGKILKDHQGNIRQALLEIGCELSYNEFSEKMMVTDEHQRLRPLDDRMLNSMWLRMDREIHLRPTFAFYERVITDLAYENSYHPVRDYLSSLKWDGDPRINSWLAVYGGVTVDPNQSSAYLEAVSSIPLIAAVRRVMKPGCKYDEMLILESDQQGLGKSSTLRALCPNEEWFSDDLPLDCDSKEIIERTLGKWIIEASDLVGGRKSDRDHLKAMLSRQSDGPARMAYARIPIERQRHFVIIGTTNSSEYLADSTGARRFWPVRINSFDIEGIIKWRDQLWAEAVVREAAGESIRLPQSLWGDAGQHQEQRREVDAWEETIRDEVSRLEPASSGRVSIAADAIWVSIGVTDVSRRDRLGAKRIAEIMQRFGFKRTVVRDDAKKVVTGYIREPGTRALEDVAKDHSVEDLLNDLKPDI